MCHVVLSPFRWQSWMSSCEDLSLPCSVHKQNVGCGCYQFSPDWADKSHVTARLVPVWDSLRRRVGPPFADRSRSSPQHTVSVWDDRERLGWQLPRPVPAGLQVDCQLSLFPQHGTGTATVRGGRIRSMAASPGQHCAPTGSAPVWWNITITTAKRSSQSGTYRKVSVPSSHRLSTLFNRAPGPLLLSDGPLRLSPLVLVGFRRSCLTPGC